MPLIPFGEYRPDVSDYEASTERDAQNVVPRADGFGPFPSLLALSQSLGGQCRGAFQAFKPDGSVIVFAATATDLYVLNNITFGWTRVSQGGASYSAVPASDQWRFAQFNNLVMAVQANVLPQVYDITTSAAFANLNGSPPQARYIDVVGRFVVLSGLLSTPQRVQWSGLNDINGPTSWTPGISQADYQDLPDGGFVRGVAGGETGIILQDNAIRRMTYIPGSPIIFQIERLSQDKGLFGPYSLVRAGEHVFFYSSQGFQRIDPGGFPVPIGRERVDRTFLADLDTNNLQLFLSSADPRSSRILWAYKSVNGTTNQFDKLLCYDWVLDKFTTIKVSGEYLLQVAQPGLTLEGLDAIAPGAMAVTGAANNGAGLVRVQVASTAALAGRPFVSLSGVSGTTEANGNWWISVVDATHFDLQGSAFAHAYVSGGLVGGSVDAMTQSLDNFASANPIELAAFDPTHMLNFFRGPFLEATLESAEQGTDGRRLKIRGFRPVTDAPTLYGSASARENQQQLVTAGAESLINPITGKCDLLKDTRYSRYKVRIPAGTAWSFIAGIEPDTIATGKR
ncbi:MAG: hypothetical protein AB1586_33105 [Pseudomonadota bacterium]